MKTLPKQKLYYSISEVAEHFGEEQYVLRYWEKEFPMLRPQKNRAGNRAYTEKDISIIAAICKLLREEKFTIEGAREMMKYFDQESGTFRDGMLSEKNISQNGHSASEEKFPEKISETDLDELKKRLPDNYVIMHRADVEEFYSIMSDVKKLLKKK